MGSIVLEQLQEGYLQRCNRSQNLLKCYTSGHLRTNCNVKSRRESDQNFMQKNGDGMKPPKKDTETKNVLLLVDFQEGFVRKNIDHLREPVQALVRDQIFSQVIATRFLNLEGSPWRRVLQWEGLQSSEEQKMAVELPEHAIIIDKSTYGLERHEFNKLLSEIEGCRLFLAGVKTDICVSIIAASLFDADIIPIIISDCTGTNRGAEHQRHALETLSRIVGQRQIVRSLKEWKELYRESNEEESTIPAES